MQETNQTTKRTKNYTCEFCQKVFTQKIDYIRHTKKKNACVSLEQLQEIVQTTQTINNEKTTLINIFKACLNILRDNEGLTGEKALRTLSHLLTWKLLEQHFGGEINIDDYEYKFEEYFEDEVLEHSKNRLLSCVRFSNLINEDENNLPNMMKYIWDIILSEHPSTNKVFLKGDGFKIVRQTSYKRLLNKLNELPLTNNDILGDAYEEVTKDIMKGKVLGQFFTPHLVKSLMINLINPQIYENGTIETICDPTMGTGGFLISYLKNILKKSVERNIQLDWNFIKTQGIYGKEIEPDTYQLAMSNMLISSGHVFEHLERGDSIRNPIIRKFDNILANPPFGIKGLKYDEFRLDENVRNSYVPIKTDNAVSLFIQAIICMLNINGKCAVVLPDGQDLFSKSNKTLIAIREYLMKTCDLQEIIYLPSGIFTYTSIKTCIFYFVKKVEGNEVMEIKFKKNKNTNVETRTSYKFVDNCQTTNVKFYDYNPYENVKNLLVDVPIERIKNNSYSLNYAEYLESDTTDENDKNDENYMDDKNREEYVIIKTLDQVFNITKGSLQSSKNIEGEYTFITASDTNKTHNSYTHNCECVMLVGGAEGSLAKAQYFKGKFIASDLLYILISKNQYEINYKYIWYYLNFNREKYLMDDTICCGTPKKMISKDRCSNIKITIPSLKRQQEIVKYLDFIYEKANKTSEEKIKELKQLNEYCLNNEIKYGSNIAKTLGEVCKFNIGGTPLRNKNEYYENGNNLWVSVRELNGGYIYDTKEKITDLGVENSSVKLFERNTILFSFKLSIGKTAIVGNPLYTNEAIAGILSKDENLLNNKYLYYYLSINDFSKMSSGLIGNGSLNKKSLAEINILIPSLKKQRQIIEYCDRNCELIKQLENEIENNKLMAKQFLNNVLKITNDDENETIDEDEDCHLKTCGLEEEEKEETIVKKRSIKIDDEEDEDCHLKTCGLEEEETIVKKRIVKFYDEETEYDFEFEE